MHARVIATSRMSSTLRAAALALPVLLAAAGAVRADADRNAAALALHPRYRAECAACHIAYPPDMLPASSWQRLLRNLPQHFGTDASLDAATVQELSQWLSAHAASPRRVGEAPPQDRVTRSAWFARQHDEVRPATWKLPAVKSPANCAACHTQADQGDFDERHLRIPR